jgi:hypothetical protein
MKHDLLDGGRGFDMVLASPGDDASVSVERVTDGPC